MVAAPLFASALSLLAGGNATGSGSHAGPELGLDGLPSPTEQVAPEVEEARTASGFLAMFVCLGVLVVGTLVVVAMRRARSSVPEAWVFTFCGAVIAAVIWSGASEQLQLIRSAVHDSFSGIFFSALLPVVIFESGYSMHRESFFQHFWPISTYALLGTLLSTAVVSMFMWIQGALGLGFEWSALDASIFGTVASATDPVTVLAVFTALRVDRQLYALVFGEAVLNDAVAIVLFHTLMSFHGQTSLSFGTVLGGVLSFLTTFLGSTLIGVGVAASTALLFKHLRPDATLAGLERALITLLPFSAYFLAEGLQLSGVVAILFTGVGMAHYTRRNLTQPTRAFSLALFSVMAFICEALVFVYIGLSLPMLVQPGLLGMWSTLLGSVVACLVGRAVHVYACTALINAQAGPQDPRHVPPTHAFVMWFSGLRGGTAFALSAAARSVLPDAAAAQVMEGASLFIVLLSLAVIGGGIGPLVRAKRLCAQPAGEGEGDYAPVATQEEPPPPPLSQGASTPPDAQSPAPHTPPRPRRPGAGSDSEGGGDGDGPDAYTWGYLDAQYLTPLFIRTSGEDSDGSQAGEGSAERRAGSVDSV